MNYFSPEFQTKSQEELVGLHHWNTEEVDFMGAICIITFGGNMGAISNSALLLFLQNKCDQKEQTLSPHVRGPTFYWHSSSRNEACWQTANVITLPHHICFFSSESLLWSLNATFSPLNIVLYYFDFIFCSVLSCIVLSIVNVFCIKCVFRLFTVSTLLLFVTFLYSCCRVEFVFVEFEFTSLLPCLVTCVYLQLVSFSLASYPELNFFLFVTCLITCSIWICYKGNYTKVKDLAWPNHIAIVCLE